MAIGPAAADNSSSTRRREGDPMFNCTALVLVHGLGLVVRGPASWHGWWPCVAAWFRDDCATILLIWLHTWCSIELFFDLG